MIPILALLVLAAHIEAPRSLDFELGSDPVVIPMKLQDGRIVVDVRVDGKGPVPFVLDTGAHGSVIDLAYAQEAGLVLGDEIRVGSPGGEGRAGRRVTIAQAGIGGLMVRSLPAVAFEPWPFPKSPTAPRGVLSPYGLSGLLVELDYPGKRVVFRRGELPEPDGREVFGWDRARGLPEIPVSVAGRTIPAHIDSGAAAGLSLPESLAADLPLATPLVEVGRARLVDREMVVRGAKLSGTVQIGRYTLENPQLDFVDIAREQANVGPAILNQFTVILDPKNDRLRLKGPEDGRIVAAERPKRYGIQFRSPDATPLEVSGVIPGRPAEKAGLRPGDRIVEINGRAAAGMSADERSQALRESPLRLVVQRGNETIPVEMKLD